MSGSADSCRQGIVRERASRRSAVRLPVMKVLRILLPVLLLVSIGACVDVAVTTNTDPTADFSSYRTFMFSPDRPTDDLPSDSTVRQRLEKLIAEHLQRKHLAEAPARESADLVVRYWVLLSGETESGEGKTGHGTLVLDLVDRRRDTLAWRVLLSAAVTGNRELNLEKATIGLDEAFDKFPAGKEQE